MTVGERIKTCRQNTGMSQEKVADLIGVSRQAVTKWEADQSAPNTENLFKLAELFGTTVDMLLDTEMLPIHLLLNSFILFSGWKTRGNEQTKGRDGKRTWFRP